MKQTTAYIDILEVLEKYADVIKQDHSIDIIDRVRSRIALQEISKEFGIDMKPDSNPEWIKLCEYVHIGLLGTEHNRTIAWEDNDNQPENEHLMKISFPSGPYIFSGEYPDKTFKAFFLELKSYGPKYCDTANSSLYYASDTAHKVYLNFSAIFDKYRAAVSEELRLNEIIKTEKKLEKLKNRN